MRYRSSATGSLKYTSLVDAHSAVPASQIAAEVVAGHLVGRVDHHDGQPIEPGDVEFLVPVAVEVLGEEADQIVLAVAERGVAAVAEVVGW